MSPVTTRHLNHERGRCSVCSDPANLEGKHVASTATTSLHQNAEGPRIAARAFLGSIAPTEPIYTISRLEEVDLSIMRLRCC
jgi:hypothetical protein